MKESTPYQFNLSHLAWDLFCVASVIGIWPRFIEPRLVKTTSLTLPISNLPPDLKGLKILQFSDLHLSPKISDRFLKKVIKQIKELAPDLIVFTGDLLTESQLQQPERLREFLSQITAPLGCYAILGNHDYQQYVSVNKQGNYDLITRHRAPLKKGLKRLFVRPLLTGRILPKKGDLTVHSELKALLNQTSFKLLHNQTTLIPVKNSYLNLCGLGEYIAGQSDPRVAFANYNSAYPGILLAHNPDSIPALDNYPGQLILCGHTHGAQINLPWLWNKFTLLENQQFKRGLISYKERWVYVNRGLGGMTKFRWFSPPELTCFILGDTNG